MPLSATLLPLFRHAVTPHDWHGLRYRGTACNDHTACRTSCGRVRSTMLPRSTRCMRRRSPHAFARVKLKSEVRRLHVATHADSDGLLGHHAHARRHRIAFNED